jgi:serine protease Do
VQKIFGANSGQVQSTIQHGVYKEDSAIIEAVKQASPAVVSIVISEDINKLQSPNNGFSPFFGFPTPPRSTTPNIQEVGAGSGFFVTKDGLVLTNKHVASIEQASYSVVTTDGKSYPAQVVARDPVDDIAILKIDIQNAPILPLADSNQTQIGQQVVAIGNSLGEYQNTVTHGIVSGIGRTITAGGGAQGQGAEQLEGVIQTDAAINPGNSGGPLLNLAGQVIGINTAVDQQGQLVGFALPSNLAGSALASYQKSGKISRPFLGVRYVIVTPALAESKKLARDYGALIIAGSSGGSAAVVAGSPAEKAGLLENDIILEVNGNKINVNNTLARQLQQYNSGDNITLKIYRNGSEKTINVALGEFQ